MGVWTKKVDYLGQLSVVSSYCPNYDYCLNLRYRNVIKLSPIVSHTTAKIRDMISLSHKGLKKKLIIKMVTPTSPVIWATLMSSLLRLITINMIGTKNLTKGSIRLMTQNNSSGN